MVFYGKAWCGEVYSLDLVIDEYLGFATDGKRLHLPLGMSSPEVLPFDSIVVFGWLIGMPSYVCFLLRLRETKDAPVGCCPLRTTKTEACFCPFCSC